MLVRSILGSETFISNPNWFSIWGECSLSLYIGGNFRGESFVYWCPVPTDSCPIGRDSRQGTWGTPKMFPIHILSPWPSLLASPACLRFSCWKTFHQNRKSLGKCWLGGKTGTRRGCLPNQGGSLSLWPAHKGEWCPWVIWPADAAMHTSWLFLGNSNWLEHEMWIRNIVIVGKGSLVGINSWTFSHKTQSYTNSKYLTPNYS